MSPGQSLFQATCEGMRSNSGKGQMNPTNRKGTNLQNPQERLEGAVTCANSKHNSRDLSQNNQAEINRGVSNYSGSNKK